VITFPTEVGDDLHSPTEGPYIGQWATWCRQSIPLAESRYMTYLKEKEES
jgi:hypothetical protein